MKIKLKKISIREVSKDYSNDKENGVFGYGGNLNIRPKYQREFIYKDKQMESVINTVRKDYPLNVMYWVKNSDGTYEILDGKQRTMSICEYIKGVFSINKQYFEGLEDDEREQILNYKLMIYFCEGTPKEKLDWFEIINIAGEKLTKQEIRNAIYTGTWLADAKRHFSKTGCGAYNIGCNYMKGKPIRQEYLETVIDWISKNDIKQYMADNQHEPNANELWLYFKSVISWIETIFPTYRNEMKKGVPFGILYNEFKDEKIDSSKIDSEITTLMQDEDVTRKSGIYQYVLTRKESQLHIRAFSKNQKREAYERQDGNCPVCGKHFELKEMEGDHKNPWHLGGKTIPENCQMLCKEDNRTKSGK